MERAMNRYEQLAAHSKDYARLLLTIGENRVELLAVELQEELRHLLRMIMLMFAVAVFGLLAGIALTAALVLVMKYPPATVLLVMTGLYTVAGVLIYWRLARLLADWQFMGDSIHQLRKDRPCSET
jgi:uncharacterized membrane protein YqjE